MYSSDDTSLIVWGVLCPKAKSPIARQENKLISLTIAFDKHVSSVA